MKVSLCYKCPECGNFISTDQQWVGGGGNLLIVPDCRSTQRVQIYMQYSVCVGHMRIKPVELLSDFLTFVWILRPRCTLEEFTLLFSRFVTRRAGVIRVLAMKTSNPLVKAPKHCANTLPSWRGTGRYFGQTLRCKINTEKLIIFLQIIV